jgi:transcriptional regulator with XRE-family HTH domain
VVRAARKAKGFSQEGFADHVGVHRTYMGLVERGKSVVTIITMWRISEGLGIEPSELVKQTSLRAEAASNNA